MARDAAVLEGLARPIAWQGPKASCAGAVKAHDAATLRKDGDLDLLNGTWDTWQLWQ